MTARGMSLRIWWDCHRGCCEAGPPPSMPRCRVSIHENLERILWLRKRRRRRRPRRRRPRSRRRSEFWPGWSAQLRPGSQLRVQFGEWRAAGPPFSFWYWRTRSPDGAQRNPGLSQRNDYPGLRFAPSGLRTERSALRKRELGAERGKSRRKTPAQPGHRLRARDDAVAQRGSEQAVDREHRKRHRHEGGTQFQHPRQGMRLVDGDELRQEGQEEDREFWIEDVDQDRRHDDAPAGTRRSRRARIDRQ